MEVAGHDRVIAMASGAKIEFANKQGPMDPPGVKVFVV